METEEKELQAYFKKEAQKWFGMTFAGLCEETDYESFCAWYIVRHSSEPTYEKFLLAKWVWQHYN